MHTRGRRGGLWPRREARMSIHTPAMHGPEKSDGRVVPMKPSNKVAGLAAERGREGGHPRGA